MFSVLFLERGKVGEREFEWGRVLGVLFGGGGGRVCMMKLVSWNVRGLPSAEASRGLLRVWDISEVEVWTSVSGGDHFMMIHIRFF